MNSFLGLPPHSNFWSAMVFSFETRPSSVCARPWDWMVPGSWGLATYVCICKGGNHLKWGWTRGDTLKRAFYTVQEWTELVKRGMGKFKVSIICAEAEQITRVGGKIVWIYNISNGWDILQLRRNSVMDTKSGGRGINGENCERKSDIRGRMTLWFIESYPLQQEKNGLKFRRWVMKFLWNF